MDDMSLKYINMLFDQFRRGGAWDERMSTTVVDATSAWQWWAHYDEKVNGTLQASNYHTLQLPYPYMLFHGESPRSILIDGKLHDFNNAQANGYCVNLTFAIQFPTRDTCPNVFQPAWDKAGEDCASMLVLVQYAAAHNQVARVGSIGLPLDATGKCVADQGGAMVDPRFASVNTGMSEDQLVDYLVATMQPILFAIALMHAKNIVVRDDPPSRAARRRGEVIDPRVRTYTLEVTGVRAASGGHATASGQLLNALHMCRGNFATYSEANKLFGRLTGTFWRPAHVKGHASRGTIEKDYRVKA